MIDNYFRNERKKKMAGTIKLPRWLEDSIQSLSYWIGYQHSLYPHYSLPELAINSELLRLIHINLPDNLLVGCEVSYKDISPKVLKDIRADIVVMERDSANRKAAPKAKHVFEIKRADASKKLIREDLIKLTVIKSCTIGVRTFLVIVSQKSRPVDYVTSDGMAEKEMPPIEISGRKPIRYKVRRVAKASGSFKSKETAHYCCLLEVV